MFNALRLVLVGSLLAHSAWAHAEGKFLGAAGVMQIEGAGGGGLVPWATLSGYDTREQISVTAFASQASVDHFRLLATGVSIGIRDRVELSLARQTFDVHPLALELRQDVFGAKLRLHGDAIYTRWPQISAGVQHKRLADAEVAESVGAGDSDSGTDIYLAATKIFVGGVAGYNAVTSLNLRRTKANQLGLLGFGGDQEDNAEWLLEASAAVLLNAHWALGMEYRQKPDNLSFAKEEDWRDLFLAYLPNRQLSLTMAWVQLGDVAGQEDQSGVYVSLSGALY